MSILARIGDLIAAHDEQEVTFTKCTGCSTCEEITRLREILEPKRKVTKKKQKPRTSTQKNKKVPFKKDDLYELIMQGLNSRDISEKLNVPKATVATRITEWFPNYKELKLKAARLRLATYDKDNFSLEIYQELKAHNVPNEEIAEYFRMTIKSLEYKLKKWKNPTPPKKKNPKLSSGERIKSLIQENAHLEIKLHEANIESREKDITIQYLKDQIAEMESQSNRDLFQRRAN